MPAVALRQPASGSSGRVDYATPPLERETARLCGTA